MKPSELWIKFKQLAESNDINQKLFYQRLHHGWTPKDSATYPIQRDFEYALYKGEQIIGMGTINELAKLTGKKPTTIRFYGTPAYARRCSEQNSLRLIRISDIYIKDEHQQQSEEQIG